MSESTGVFPKPQLLDTFLVGAGAGGFHTHGEPWLWCIQAHGRRLRCSEEVGYKESPQNRFEGRRCDTKGDSHSRSLLTVSHTIDGALSPGVLGA